MKKLLIATFVSLSMFTTAQRVIAQAEEKPSYIHIDNVIIFDGVSEELIEGAVLVENNQIMKVGVGLEVPPGAVTVDGKGHTLMPGLTDAHVHLMLNDSPANSIYEDPWVYAGAKAVACAEAMLMRGFTTVRDVGGPAGGLAAAIDEGIVPGPRVYPSGPFISQTSGHGDLETSKFKLSPYFTGIPDKLEIFGWGYVADGPTEVIKAAREVLRTGATQIKVMAGGGVSSYFDPLDTTQYTVDELRSIVTEAENWGTYVLVHAYTDKAVRNCIEAGVRCIDHGPFLTEETLKLMAEKGVWLTPQAYLFGMTPEELKIVGTPSEPKMRQVNEGSAQLLRMAKKHKVKIAWGTDLFGPPEKQAQQPLEFTARLDAFSPYEILVQATSANAELFAMCGKRNPYTEGPLGVIKPGAYADMILVRGNPLKDLNFLTDPERNLLLIMKDGVVYKDTLDK